jgi:iron complex outermembrane recepter protein
VDAGLRIRVAQPEVIIMPLPGARFHRSLPALIVFASFVIFAATGFAQSPALSTSIIPALTPPAAASTGGDQQKPADPKAEQKPGEELPKINVDVVVTAPRIEIPIQENPAATTVVGSDVLQSIPRGIGAEEALWLVPGVKVDNQANGSRVHLSIRGQGLLTERGIRGVKVLLDGLPLNDPTGFAPDLFDVDWNTVNRIEVLRGPSSALYGGGSSAGVINITTRDGAATGMSATASIDTGSAKFYKPFVEVGGTSGAVNYRVSASKFSGDGYRDHTKFDGFNLYGKAGVQAGDSTRLTFIVAGTHYYNDNAEGLNLDWLAQDRKMANPDALTYNEGQKTNRFTVGMSGRSKVTDVSDVTYSVYYRDTSWWESVPSSVQHRDYSTPGGHVQFNTSQKVSSWTNHLSVGTDLDFQSIGDYRYPNLGNAVEGPNKVSDQSIDQRGVGIFLIDRVAFTPQWSATFGLRYDNIHNDLTDHLRAGGVDLSGDASFWKTTGRIGAAYNPRPDLGIYGSWGEGFMPPATEELANNPDALGGFNQGLVPATSQGEEFGIRGGTHAFAYDVAFFHLSTDNDFGRYRVKNRPLETFYGNLGQSRRYGLETELRWVPVPEANIRAAYTFNDFLYTSIQSLFGSFSDKVIPNSPRHQFALDAEYLVAGRLAVGLGIVSQSRWYVDQTNVPSCDGFTLVNPRVSYRLGKDPRAAEIVLQVRNLFGTEYIAFTEPDPDGNSYQPGPTREVFVGLRVRVGR